MKARVRSIPASSTPRHAWARARSGLRSHRQPAQPVSADVCASPAPQLLHALPELGLDGEDEIANLVLRVWVILAHEHVERAVTRALGVAHQPVVMRVRWLVQQLRPLQHQLNHGMKRQQQLRQELQQQ